MSLSRQIVIGVSLGVGLGLAIGELAAPLQLAADAYVRLLQMAVLPYVTISLIAGLGALSPERAWSMATRAGAVLLLLWGLSLLLVCLLPLTFPAQESASFFSSSLLHPQEAFDFVTLYIPSNPFHSLANNVVPAVVLFSIVVGVALLGMDDKARLVGVLSIAGQALGRVNHLMMRLTPIGLFAIAASFSGTMRLEELEKVQVFLIGFSALAALLTFQVLPGLVTALTPVTYREFMGPAKDALLTAFMTGNLFVVLPSLGECARELMRRHVPEQPDAEELPDVIVPASFNFPHAAKLLSLAFLPFAAWFSGAPLEASEYPRMAGLGLVTFFGSLNAAIPYLLDVFRIPHDTFQLFLATGLVNARAGSALAACSTLVLAVLGSFAMSGRLVIEPGRLVRYAATTAASVALTLSGLVVYFGQAVPTAYARAGVLGSMERILPGIEQTCPDPERPEAGCLRLLDAAQPEPEEDAAAADQLGRIRARGRLRVGFMPDNPPYSFLNARQQAVGLDVEMAHQLARELGVGLDLVPMPVPLEDPEGFEAAMTRGRCDLHMSGVVLTTDMLVRLTFAEPYLEETIGFLVPDHLRTAYATRELVRERPGLVLGVPDVEFIVQRVRAWAPEAEIVRLREVAALLRFFEGEASFEALVFPAERGSIRTLQHPSLSVVVPQPPIATLPLAYPVARHDARLAAFLSNWLRIERKNDTLRELYDYWVLGKNAEPRRPRWSLLRAWRDEG